VTDSGEAQKVRVTAGEERHINVSLRVEKFVTVSGRVFDPGGKPASQIVVSLELRDAMAGLFQRGLAKLTDAQGKFEIKKVMPGSYKISAYNRVQGADDNRYWAEQRIEVSEDNVAGLLLQLSGGLELSGKIAAVGGSKLDLQSLTVTLAGDGDDSAAEVSAEVRKEGTFTVTQVRRTTNRLQLSGLPEGWYLRAVVFGTQNVLDEGLNLAGEDINHSLEITVSPGAGQFEGFVLRGTDRISGAKIKAVPEPANSLRQDRVFDAWADERGHFIIKNVPPGSYRLLAVDVESDNSDDSDPPSVVAVLAENESKTVHIKLSETKE